MISNITRANEMVKLGNGCIAGIAAYARGGAGAEHSGPLADEKSQRTTRIYLLRALSDFFHRESLHLSTFLALR